MIPNILAISLVCSSSAAIYQSGVVSTASYKIIYENARFSFLENRFKYFCLSGVRKVCSSSSVLGTKFHDFRIPESVLTSYFT